MDLIYSKPYPVVELSLSETGRKRLDNWFKALYNKNCTHKEVVRAIENEIMELNVVNS